MKNEEIDKLPNEIYVYPETGDIPIRCWDRIENHQDHWRTGVRYVRASAIADGVGVEWHTIETAPKDGTEVLLYDHRTDSCVVAAWDKYCQNPHRWHTLDYSYHGDAFTHWKAFTRPASTPPQAATDEGMNVYKCGHCGYMGPCYGTPMQSGVSAPWCYQCELNDKLSRVDAQTHANKTEGE